MAELRRHGGAAVPVQPGAHEAQVRPNGGHGGATGALLLKHLAGKDRRPSMRRALRPARRLRGTGLRSHHFVLWQGVGPCSPRRSLASGLDPRQLSHAFDEGRSERYRRDTGRQGSTSILRCSIACAPSAYCSIGRRWATSSISTQSVSTRDGFRSDAAHRPIERLWRQQSIGAQGIAGTGVNVRAFDPGTNTSYRSQGKHQSRKATASGWIGSAQEYDDFFIYGTTAALIYSQLFFPRGPQDRHRYVACDPRYGLCDRLHRCILFKALRRHSWPQASAHRLHVSYCLLTVAVGLQPTYDQVGLLAPTLLV